jgi:hypothetical protein
MECTDYLDAIGELVDGTLPPGERAALDAHLAACPACRALARDLERIRSTASALDRLRPPDEAWLRLAARLPDAGRRPRVVPRWPWLAAAAVLVLTVGLAFVLLDRLPSPGVVPAGTTPASQAAGNAAAQDPVESLAENLRIVDEHLDRAVADLIRIAESEDSMLDPQVPAELQKNVTFIDQAIADSRAALEAEPQNRPARESLFAALRRKVSLLQDTIALMNEMRKGNEAGAAQIVEGLNKS